MKKINFRSAIKLIEAILAKIGIKNVKTALFVRVLADDLQTAVAKVPVKVELGAEETILKIFKDRKEALKRLSCKELCFIPEIDNKPVGYFWVTTQKNVYIPEIEKTIAFDDNCAYQYDGYIDPELRSINVGKVAMKEMIIYLKSKNFSKFYSMTRNIAAEKVLRYFGFYPVKRFSFFRIFFFRKYKVEEINANQVI